jgi:hypothetical protein
MFPIGTSGSDQGPKVRRFPFIIIPIDSPDCAVPDGSLLMESIVFSLSPYPAEKVLGDYCRIKGLDAGKYVCHPVVFFKDLKREGKGELCIRREGDEFHGRINWRP